MDKKEQLTVYIWKGAKLVDADGNITQESKKLIDMSEDELNICYSHCKTMLFNQDPQNPGRYLVLKMIAEQKDKLGTELFLRYIEQNYNFTRFTLLTSINEFLNNNKELAKSYKLTVAEAIPSAPTEYLKIPLSLIIDGCLDRLGTFDKSKITRTFILKQGIWLTPTESKEIFTDIDPSINKLDVLRERLNLKEHERLYLNSKGLNYTQMRAMLTLKPNKKYSDLTTVQLETLRYRLLFNLEEEIQQHINSWEERMKQIEEIAEYKNIKL